jgi:hypothetical protein
VHRSKGSHSHSSIATYAQGRRRPLLPFLVHTIAKREPSASSLYCNLYKQCNTDKQE